MTRGRDDIALHYQCGSEFGASASHGLYSLALHDDGSALIERRRLGCHDCWQVTTSPQWREQVDECLARSPFADVSTAAAEGRALERVDQHDGRRTIASRGRRCLLDEPQHDPRWAPLVSLLDAPLWLVCPEYLPGRWPRGLDQSWVTPAARMPRLRRFLAR